jgi:hypothetical protein
MPVRKAELKGSNENRPVREGPGGALIAPATGDAGVLRMCC